jgi:hypothetical protein
MYSQIHTPLCIRHGVQTIMEVTRERTSIVLVSPGCFEHLKVRGERTSVVLVSPFWITRLIWVFQKTWKLTIMWFLVCCFFFSLLTSLVRIVYIFHNLEWYKYQGLKNCLTMRTYIYIYMVSEIFELHTTLNCRMWLTQV